MNGALKKQTLFSVYLIGFLLAFHSALPAYIDSSFLGEIMSKKLVGLAYTTSSIFAIITFFLIPRILKKFGNFRLATCLIALETISLSSLVIWQSPQILLAFFLLHLILIPLIYFSLDIFLEGVSSDGRTGKIRGTYLTAVNLAWISAPLISGLIVRVGGYQSIYNASALLLVPVLLVLMLNLKHFKDSVYVATPVWRTARSLWQNKNLFRIFSSSFLLQFFYSWMVIYTPIHLNQNMGFAWEKIGLIFTIMLLPFILDQFPLGKLADKKWGEKEILSVGFVVAGIATATLSLFDQGSSWWWWAIVLFITRIGASAIEIMCDTYFFKKVDSLNANMISFFRTASPLAYILGPLVATILLTVFSLNIKHLFFILGIIMFLGLNFSLRLKDTK